MIKFQCGCGKSLQVPGKHAGRRVRCPRCQTALRVPSPPEPGSRRLAMAGAGAVAGELELAPDDGPPKSKQYSPTSHNPTLNTPRTRALAGVVRNDPQTFPELMLAVVTRPLDVWRGLGHSILNSPASMAFTVGLAIFAGIVKSMLAPAGLANETLFTLTVLPLLATAVFAFCLNLSASLLTGCSQYLACFFTLLFYGGTVGLAFALFASVGVNEQNLPGIIGWLELAIVTTVITQMYETDWIIGFAVVVLSWFLTFAVVMATVAGALAIAVA